MLLWICLQIYKSTWWTSTTTTKSWFQTTVHIIYLGLPWCYNTTRCHLHLITKCTEHLSLYSSDRQENKHVAEDIAAMGWVADIKKRSRMCAEHHQRSAQGREAHAQSAARFVDYCQGRGRRLSRYQFN